MFVTVCGVDQVSCVFYLFYRARFSTKYNSVAAVEKERRAAREELREAKDEKEETLTKLEAKTAEFQNIARRVFYVDFFCRESNTSLVRPRCTSSKAVRR